jgi:DNA (cytosine-5)-methyltransferase 1
MKFKLGELFCGPGGMALGASSVKVDHNGKEFSVTHCWANDFDQDSCSTYAGNVNSATSDSVICADVKDLDINSLPEVNAFAYGFPCNDFSLVGEQKGMDGKFGGLYSYGLEVISKFNPLFIVAENVGGLSSSNGGEAFKVITKKLENSGKYGYKLTIHKYKSEQYGVPQKRHRIIIVGIRKDQNLIFKVPSPITADDFVTARQALEFPKIPSSAKNQELTRQSEIVKERLSLIKPGQNVWNADLPQHLQLNVKGARLSQIYRRLHPDQPSYTITGSGGGGTHCYHYAENRALTNRERARLQSFPDSFVFNGSKESVRKQIGMAVPPQLASVVFEAILKTFAREEYSSVPSNL